MARPNPFLGQGTGILMPVYSLAVALIAHYIWPIRWQTRLPRGV
jgi:hypothetical protein